MSATRASSMWQNARHGLAPIISDGDDDDDAAAAQSQRRASDQQRGFEVNADTDGTSEDADEGHSRQVR